MSEHVKAQAWRFVRVSGLAFLAAMATTGGRLSWASLWALGAGALEAGLRQVLPVKAIPAVSSVLAPAVSDLGLSTIPPDTVVTAVQTAMPPAGAAPLTGTTVPPGQIGTASNPAPPAAGGPGSP